MNNNPILTREEAIEKHRKMWNWIADQYKNGIRIQVYKLKQMYLEQYEPINVNIDSNCCYLCSYSDNIRKGCGECPLDWEGFSCMHLEDPYHRTSERRNGLYSQIDQLTTYCDILSNTLTAERLARKIANLPEKKKRF